MMTLEQKAAAYDKALERAQSLYNDKNEIGYANAESILEEVFPSLKESDDEKIRKELLDYLKCFIPHNDIDLVKKSKVWIAWLEKQNDNTLNANIKSCIEMILTDADEQRFKDYNTNLSVCLAWLKRQGEEKPIDWSDYDRTIAFTLMRDVDQMTCISKEAKNERIGWLNSLDEKFISEKSAWNKEDEKNLNSLSILLDDLATDKVRKFRIISENDRDYYINWLKSLKEK